MCAHAQMFELFATHMAQIRPQSLIMCSLLAAGCFIFHLRERHLRSATAGARVLAATAQPARGMSAGLGAVAHSPTKPNPQGSRQPDLDKTNEDEIWRSAAYRKK